LLSSVKARTVTALAALRHGGRMDDRELRTFIRSEIDSGRLPLHSASEKLFGGNGDGEACSCCRDIIRAGQTQFEVENGQGLLRMHLHCYDIWRSESTATAD
jgi:hypothetical protein